MKLDVVLPVYNEAIDLPKNVPIVHAFLTTHCSSYDWRIVIAEQASTDGTYAIAEELSQSFDRVIATHRDAKGRGGALQEAWKSSDADIVAYMDIDLSSRTDYFLKLLEALEDGADIAVGSRLSKESIVKNRPIGREVAARAYQLYLKLLLGVRFHDAQCGFKAIRKKAFRRIAPHLTSTGWIFDTELLVIAEKAGMRVVSIPIEWHDDLETRVVLWRYALEGFWAGIHLFLRRPWRQVIQQNYAGDQ